jgi:hypothetical protein
MKSRAELPHLKYPVMNQTRILNPHAFSGGGGGGTGLLTGLAAWWSLDETSGTRADSHSNGLDLTDNNTVGSSTGLISNSAFFNKANSEYLSAADDPALDFTTEFTASLWIKQTAYAGSDYEVFLAKGTFTSCSFNIYNRYSANTLKIFLNYNTAGWVQFNLTSFTLSTSSFDHLVVRYDGGESTNATRLRVWKNNSEVTSSGTYLGTVPTSLVNRSGDLQMGFISGLTNSYFSGDMDEVGLWNRALTTDEIADIYNSGSGLAYGDL